MSFAGCFGLGSKRIIERGERVTGTVTSVSECRWYKVNLKPVRRDSLDGAVFPHIFTFTYRVGGESYTGRRFVGWAYACPGVGADVDVYYDPRRPSRYAVSGDFPLVPDYFRFIYRRG